MYLTRVQLYTTDYPGKAYLQPYKLHGAIASSLHGDPRYLYRAEGQDDRGVMSVLISSHTAPNLTAFRSLAQANTHELRIAYKPDTSLMFRLLANPVTAHGRKRSAIVGESAQVDWLHRKLEGAARLISVEVMMTRAMMVKKGGMTFPANTVWYEGMLQVVDTARFATLLEYGVGHSKGFGLGMLSVL